MEVYLRKNVPCGPYKRARGRQADPKEEADKRAEQQEAEDPPAATGGCGWRLGHGGVGEAWRWPDDVRLV